MSNQKINEEGKVLSLAALTWPIFLELLLLMMMGNADVIMLSIYSDYSVSGVGVANQIIQFAVVMFGVISSGAVVVQSQYMGAGKNSALKRVTATAIITSFAIGIIISLAFVFFYEFILTLAGMSLYDNVLEYAHTFIVWVGGFIFFQGVLSTITALLRSYGFAKDALYINISMNIVNIIGNYVSIFGFGGIEPTGVLGVSISTVISRGFGFFLAFIILFKRVGNPFSLKGIVKRTLFYSRKILRIGIPGAGENLSYMAYQLVVTNIITTMGGIALITRIYTRTLNSFMFLFALSIAQSGAIIAGNLIGAGKLDELYKLCLKNVKIGVIVSVSMAGIFYIFGELLLSFFTDNPEVITLGSQVFFMYLFIEAGRVFNMVIISSLRAVGDVKFPVYVGIVVMWGIGVGMSYFLGIVMGMGLLGIVIAQALDECIRGFIMLGRWRSKIWQSNKLV